MYAGVGEKITAWRLSVTANQYSSAQIRVQNGDEYIQTGWREDLTLNGDTRTRSFICTHVLLDPLTGNWWLSRGREDERIGFRPKSLFKSLDGMASYVYGPPEKPSPQLGSGNSFRRDGNYDASKTDVTYRKETNDVVTATNTQESADARRYYDIKDMGNHYKESTKVFVYGGPGGMIGN
ncbi:Neprosin [Dillenia turbinata]|uniref:Neprosin n=1 Tax=Dillenia turbinata TaxID=194707 RepID=A0AAN8WG61_9MAGN